MVLRQAASGGRASRWAAISGASASASRPTPSMKVELRRRRNGRPSAKRPGHRRDAAAVRDLAVAVERRQPQPASSRGGSRWPRPRSGCPRRARSSTARRAARCGGARHGAGSGRRRPARRDRRRCARACGAGAARRRRTSAARSPPSATRQPSPPSARPTTRTPSAASRPRSGPPRPACPESCSEGWPRAPARSPALGPGLVEDAGPVEPPHDVAPAVAPRQRGCAGRPRASPAGPERWISRGELHAGRRGADHQHAALGQAARGRGSSTGSTWWSRGVERRRPGGHGRQVAGAGGDDDRPRRPGAAVGVDAEAVRPQASSRRDRGRLLDRRGELAGVGVEQADDRAAGHEAVGVGAGVGVAGQPASSSSASAAGASPSARRASARRSRPRSSSDVLDAAVGEAGGSSRGRPGRRR